MAKEADKVYEVVHTIRLKVGEKTTDRNRGDEVRRSELSEGDVESFLRQGIIRDPETPITGATTDLAHDRLTSIATQLGLIKVKGSEFSLGDVKRKGITAFRESVTLNDLERAIVEAAKAAEGSVSKTAHDKVVARVAELEAQLTEAKKGPKS